jgi:Phage integrase family
LPRYAGGRTVQDGERQFFGGDYHPGDNVFTFEDGRPPHPDTIRQRFDRLAAAAGLSRITFHDLRHSYATGAVKADINPKVVSERIGHADVGYFLQTYAHVLTNDDREAAEQAATSRSAARGKLTTKTTVQMASKANVPKRVPTGMKMTPEVAPLGSFPLVAGTGFEPATSGL